jgi:acyl-CoA dehydrogenase family protein 9
MRDIRIFPIFEGANDVLRSFVALSVLKPLGAELELLRDVDLAHPLDLLGTWGSYIAGRVQREVRGGPQITRAHDALADLAGPVGEQVARLRGSAEGLLRRHGKGVVDRGLDHRRLCSALSDIVAQVAVLSRVSGILEDTGADAAGQERFIAETFCRRAAQRVSSQLDQLERNDDERMHAIAALAYKRGSYGYSLFEGP